MGNIFEDIGKIAKKEHVQLIIMGTHGQVGMQKIFGSHAMKVITSSNIPFLVVQEKTPMVEIKNIIVPIDLTKESLQITNVAGDLAKMFHAQIHVIYEKQNDAILGKKLSNRVLLVKNNYDERMIESEFESLDGSGSYQKKVLDYTQKTNGDLIALSYHSESLLPQFDKFAQTLMTNEMNLPCVIINSKSSSNLYF